MNCGDCEHENPAGNRFCGSCGAPLARSCPACAHPNPPEHRFCGACGASLQAPEKERPLRDVQAYTPKHLADKILATKSALEGERKQVTVLFADVKGSMEPAQQLDPEAWHAILDRFFTILTDGVHRFEGTVNQYTGDGIMALFGAPIAHEDHAQRACYAALHLRGEIARYATELKREHGVGFQARMGIHSGEVVVGKIGDDLRMDYTAQGHTVGLAQWVGAIAGSRGLLLLNFRPEYHATWMSKSYYRQIPLAPLGPDAVRALLDDLLGGDASLDGLAKAIHARAGGNPFFTEEVVQSLIESGALAGTRGSYRLVMPIERLKVPPTVQALLAARIDRLGEREKQVLQAAAVIGKDFPEPILRSVLPDADLGSALRLLKDAEFVYEQSLYPVAEYAFKHPLTQEVALHSQLKEQRRRTHAAVARALEAARADRLGENAALLAHHHEEAGEASAAARWHRRAAEWAGLSDIQGALYHWQRVRELARQAGDDMESAALTALACSQAFAIGGWRVGGSAAQWAEVFEEGCAAAERAGDLAALVRLKGNYGAARGLNQASAGDYVRYTGEAVEIADRTDDAALRCGTRAYLMIAHLWSGHLWETERLAYEVVELAGGDPDLGAHITTFSPLLTARFNRDPCIGFTRDPATALRADRNFRLRSGSTTWKRHVAQLLRWSLGAALVFSPVSARSAPEPEWWEHLPQMHTLAFSKTALGLVAEDGRRFVIDRATLRLEPIDASAFDRSWPDAQPVAKRPEPGSSETIVLRTTVGREFRARDAYCSEGEDNHHQLLDGETLVEESIDPCYSISSAEIVGDQLWLGTRVDGEGGTYPAEGVLIKPLSGVRASRSIRTKQGLTGDLIRVIRNDPYRKTTWVVSEQGLNELDANANVILTRYFYEDFDASGRPIVQLSPVPRASDPLAVLARQLDISDTQAYYAAVLGLPAETRSRLTLGEPLSPFGGIAPAELNALAPFVMSSARSEDREVAFNAMQTLCHFNDSRVRAFLRSIETSADPVTSQVARACLDLHFQRGFVEEPERSDRATALLEQERAALEKIRSAPADGFAPHPEVQNVIGAAQSLKTLGSAAGLDLLNVYFGASAGGKRDADLLDGVLQSLYANFELTPSALIGLRRFDPTRVGRSCEFFSNVLAQWIGERYDASYAEALLVALQRMRERERSGTWPRVPEYAVKTCGDSLASQLRHAVVRQAFLERVYPSLSTEQREIAAPLLH